MNPDKITIKEGKRFSRQDIAFCLVREGETDQFYFGSSDAQVHHIDLSAEKPESKPFDWQPLAAEFPRRHSRVSRPDHPTDSTKGSGKPLRLSVSSHSKTFNVQLLPYVCERALKYGGEINE